MLNPYELDFISAPQLYQIDPVEFDVYEIDTRRAKRICSVYEHDGILRSLLLKSESFNNEFLDLLYTTTEDDKIYFNLTNDQSEKFILSFKLTSNDESIVTTALQSLRDNRAEIVKWIRGKCEIYETADFFNDVQEFPRYMTPDIVCEIQHSLYSANLKDIQINGISLECELQYKVEDHITITFEVGKASYKLLCHKIWESTDSKLQQKRVGLKLDFIELDNFNAWKKLVMAFHLRQHNKKSNT